jgi:hypothetical protein
VIKAIKADSAALKNLCQGINARVVIDHPLSLPLQP